MTETPPVEWRLTPVGQRYLILRSWRKSHHERCHGCGLLRDGVVRCQKRALVAKSVAARDLLQRQPLVIYRAVLRRVQPAPALRCPQGSVFNISAGATD